MTMAKQKKTLWQEFTKGIIKENPVLRLVLGTCATLAVTSMLSWVVSGVSGVCSLAVSVSQYIVTMVLSLNLPFSKRMPLISPFRLLMAGT